MNMNDYAQIALALFRVVLTAMAVIITSVLIPWLRKECIPWLKERRLYGLVSTFVQAAEKVYQNMSGAGTDKKQFVIDALRDKGYEITDEIAAYIESAVEELDLFTLSAVSGLADAFNDNEWQGGFVDEGVEEPGAVHADAVEERQVSED